MSDYQKKIREPIKELKVNVAAYTGGSLDLLDSRRLF